MAAKLSPQDELKQITAERERIARREQDLKLQVRADALKSIWEIAVASSMASQEIVEELLKSPFNSDGTPVKKQRQRRATKAAKSAKVPKGAKGAKLKKTAAKWRDPKTGRTWSGVGRRPQWYLELEAAGRLEKARI